MLKKVGALVMATIMLGTSLSAMAVPVSDEEKPADEVTVAGYPSSKGFDPETVMWTNNPIENVLAEQGVYANAAEVNPNADNKTKVLNSSKKEIQSAYGKPGETLTGWAYSEFIWTNSYPVGNGRMAGMVAGGIDKEVIQINEDTSWDGSPYGTLQDENGNKLTTLAQTSEAEKITTVDQTSGSKAEAWRYFRGANEDGSPAEIGASNVLVGDEAFRSAYPDFANKSIANQALNVNNAKTTSAVQQRYSMERMVEKTILGSPTKQRAYKSFVEVYLDFGQEHSKATDYTKSLDMETGVVTVEYDYEGSHFKRETIASYPDQVVATHVESNNDLNFSAELHTYHEDSSGNYYEYEKVSDKEVKVTASISNGSKDNSGVGTVNVINIEAHMFLDGDGAFSVADDNKTVNVKGGNSADIYVVGATNYVDYLNLDNTKPARDCEYYKANVVKRTYSEIKDRHIADFAPEFAKTSLTLTNDTKYANEFSELPTEQRVRQNIKGKSGFLTGGSSRTSDANKAGVYTTYSKGDNQLATLQFNYGKYLILAGARDARTATNADEINIPQSQPLNLTGKWSSGLSASWNGKYTININTEMNYWAAQPLNIGESEKTLIDTFDELAQGGAITAANQYAVYNERGDDTYQPGDPWVMHHNFDLWRGTQPIDNATAGLWPTGGVWLLDHAWQYYQYNNDLEYLAEVYPYMVGAAKFFVETLVIDPQTGYLVTAASCSPEQGGVQPGAAMDTQLVRNLYDMVQNASEILGKTAENATVLAKIAEQMPATYLSDEQGKVAPNLIDSAGLIKEWARGDVSFDLSITDEASKKYTVTNPFANNATIYIKEHGASNSTGHRHCSHLWELYPGTHLNPYTEDADEKKIFAAYQKSTSARGPGSGQGWGLAWRMSLNARALNGDYASDMFEQLLTTRTSPNLFDQHPNFQIDGNYGITAGVIEMLVQSHADSIDLLPAVPKKWQAGEFAGINTRRGAIVDLSWDGGIPREAKIHATKTGDISVRSKYAAQAKVYDSNNALVEATLSDNNNKITFAMVDGETYTITSFGSTVTEGDVAYLAGSASDFFASDGGTTPKLSNSDTNVGYIYRRDGVKVGYALNNVSFDNLKQLMLNMVKVRDDDTYVSITLDSVNGTEIANQIISTGDNIIELKNLDGVVGTHKVYLAFTQNPYNTTSTDKYLGDAGDLIGTYKSEVDPTEPTAPPRPLPTDQPIIGGTPTPLPTSEPKFTYEISDANIDADNNLSLTLNYDGEIGEDKGNLIVGAYNVDGALVDSAIFDVNGTTITDFGYTMPEDADKVSLYVWDGVDTMIPLSDVKEAFQSEKPTATPEPTNPPVFATYTDWNIGQSSAEGVDGEGIELEYNGKTAINVAKRNIYKTLDSTITNGTATLNTKVYIDPTVAKSFRIYLENEKALDYVDKTNSGIIAEVTNNTATAIDYGPVFDTTTQLFSYSGMTSGWYDFDIIVDYSKVDTDEFITLTVSDAEGNEQGSVMMGSISGVDTALKQIRIVQTAVNVYVADMTLVTGESPTIDPSLPTKTPAPTEKPTATPTPIETTNPDTTYTVDLNQETNVDNRVFNSVRDAVLAANANPPASEADRIYINVAPGVYRAQVDVKAPYVTIQKQPGTEGEAKLTWYYGTSQLYDSADSNGKYDPSGIDGVVGKGAYGWGGTLIVDSKANNFIAKDLTLENSYNQYYTQEELTDILEVDPNTKNSFFKRVEWINAQIANGVSDDVINNWLQSRTEFTFGGVKSSPRERACALYASGDKSQFYNCRVTSKQDTIGINSGRMYFKDCFLAGTVDYICGSAEAVFSGCELNYFSGPNMEGSSKDLDAGTVTAPSNPVGTNGYLFFNCNITGTEYTSPGSLGRPWSGPSAGASYINTVIDNCTRSGYAGKPVVADSGWSEMTCKPEDACFTEYNSIDPNGKAVNTSSRTKGTLLNEWTMLRYNPLVFTSGKDAWDPEGLTETYAGVNGVINSTTIDTSDGSTNIISLPSAPSGYEFSWASDSEYATVSSDKTKMTVIRPANGEAPIKATVKLFVREAGNKTIGGEKSIAFNIEPTIDVENVFEVSGIVTLSSVSDADQAITIQFKNGEAVIKTTVVTVVAGSTSQTYTANNIPVGSYVAYPTTANAYYNVSPVSQNVTGIKGQTVTMDISAKKMQTITVSSGDFTSNGYTPSITSATGFSAGAYTATGDETANLGEAGGVFYKVTKDEGNTVAAKTGVSFDVKSMLPAGTSFANTKTIKFSYDFIMETIDYYPSDQSYFDLATSKTNAGADAIDQTKFARTAVMKNWGQLNFFGSTRTRINGDNTHFNANNNMQNKWYRIVYDIDLENNIVTATAYDRDWKTGDAGTYMLNNKPFTISAPDEDGANPNYPTGFDLSKLYFNIYMDKTANTSNKMEYFFDNLEVEYQDYE